MIEYLGFLCITVICFTEYEPTANPMHIQRFSPNKRTVLGDRVFIDSIADIRTVLGQCKNVTVCQHGDNVAVIYGVTEMPGMSAQIAYSIDSGANWSYYGPIGYAQTVEVSLDGSPNFCTVPGQLYYVLSLHGWYDAELCMMIEENVPSAPSFSVPTILPNSQPPAMWPWEPCIAIAQDNPSYLVVTAWSFLPAGNEWAYCWISTDGGYTWTDSIPMAFITQDGAAGHVRQGTGGYAFYTYQDYYNYTPGDSTPYPYYMESTDGGYSWSPEAPIPGVPVNSGSMFWWHEFDCEVVNNEPWAIHKDIGMPGGGPYVMHGTGNPGNWTWEIFDAGQLGACSLTIADTTFYCYPSQYPNLSYDPVSNTVLASYKAYYYKEHGGTITYDGAHIGGIYTTDNGANWTISQPLSDTNTTQIAWPDWSATDVAHRLVNIGGDVWSYALWVDGTAPALYFERGLVTSFLPLAINESNEGSILHTRLNVTPSISRGRASIDFSLSQATRVEIKLYEINGRLIENIHEGYFSGGDYSLDLQTYDLPDGIYFVSLHTEYGVLTQKIVLMR